LNGGYQVKSQIPDAEECVEEGCNEAALEVNYDHKATIKAPEHFSSLNGSMRGCVTEKDRGATHHEGIGNAGVTNVVSNRRDVQAK
jgi:hypothetical protein